MSHLPPSHSPDRISRLIGVALRRLELQATEKAVGHLERVERAVSGLERLLEGRFEAEVIEPLIRRAIPAIDLLTDGLAGGNGDQAAILGAQCELLELLAGYGVEPLRARRSAAFDPRWMRPEQVRSTSHQRQHMTVAATTRLGFRRDQRVLRPASVVIFKYKEPSSHDRSH